MRRSIHGLNISQRRFWKLTRDLQGSTRDYSSRIPPMKKDDDIITDNETKCTEFAKAFIAKSSLPEGGQFIRRQREFNVIPPFEFTPPEVQRWLKKLNPSKAAGPNNISPRVYQKLSTSLALPLHRLYSRMLKTGQWPRQ